jgi:hypothetical protein
LGYAGAADWGCQVSAADRGQFLLPVIEDAGDRLVTSAEVARWADSLRKVLGNDGEGETKRVEIPANIMPGQVWE